MFDVYSLKKLCIAEVGLDPELLWNYVSNGTKTTAKKILVEIQERNKQHPLNAELEIGNHILELSKDPRKKRLGLIILMMAFFEYKLISGEYYTNLRRQLGIQSLDEVTKKSISDRWNREKSQDPFSVLETNVNNNNTVQMPQQQQELPIAAKLQNKQQIKIGETKS